ncbi:MAG: hypothetical protein QOI19_440, partial [Thermoleophilaceae bacterium]|nr:hypothetical protein [Thermoleophilaceae bacterium]
LGQHFHPLVMVLTPLYWIWADPVMLIVAQAFLVAAAAVPVFHFALPRVGRVGAYALAAAYLGFWAAHAGVAFDFHEVAFAPLLIATAVLMIDRERWVPFLVAAGLLLLVKEDMSVVVVALGLYAAARGHIRPALASVAGGIVWFFLSTKVLIPAFADGRPFTFWSYRAFGPDLPQAAANVVVHPVKAVKTLFTPYPKAATLGALFVPFLLLPLASLLVIVCAPLVVERMFSSDAVYWYPLLHYSLTVSPVIAMAAADGAHNLSRLLPSPRRVGVTTGLSIATLVAVVALSASEAFQPVPGAPLSPLARPGDLGIGAHAATRASASRALAAIPSDASVAASPNALPHVSERKHVSLLLASQQPSAEYLLQFGGDLGRSGSRIGMKLPPIPPSWLARYEVAMDADGVRLLHRRSQP